MKNCLGVKTEILHPMRYALAVGWNLAMKTIKLNPLDDIEKNGQRKVQLGLSPTKNLKNGIERSS